MYDQELRQTLIKSSIRSTIHAYTELHNLPENILRDMLQASESITNLLNSHSGRTFIVEFAAFLINSLIVHRSDCMLTITDNIITVNIIDDDTGLSVIYELDMVTG